jgi:Ca-activated chloride channel family protein
MGLSQVPFHFLHPAWLLALPLLLLFAAWLSRASRGDTNWSRVVDSQLLALLRVEEGRRHRVAPWLLLGAVWTLAVFALAGPTWKRSESPAFRAPAAWVMVMDLSPSMSTTDVSPNRVTRARYAAIDLLSAAHDARVGLIAFAGEPHTVTPLTTDIATIRLLLQPLAPSLMPEAGDRLAPALEEAEGLLKAGISQHGQVIVFSDGFSDPAAAFQVAQRLRQEGASVNVVAVGAAQSEMLKRVAAAGGGEFVPASGVSGLLARLQSIQSQEVERGNAATEARLTTWQNGGVWLLPPLLLLAALLARRGWI